MSEENSIASLDAFTRHNVWTLWRLNPHPTNPTADPVKLPVHYDGVTHHSLGRKATRSKPARDPNPAPPLSADQARQWLAYQRAQGLGHDRPGEVGYLGIGFRPAGTGLVCLDIDDCLTPEGQWSPLATEMMLRFPGALVELSHRGHGLHLWFTSAQPVGRHGKDRSGRLEMYDSGQFIAVGRQVLAGDAATDHTAAAAALLAEFWPPARMGARDITAPLWDELDAAKQAEVLADLKHALGFISADDRDTWIGVGQALASLGDPGFDLWDEWSQTSDAYKGREDLERAAVTGDRTGYQSVFARAQAHPEYLNPRSTEARIAQAMAGFGTGVVPTTQHFVEDKATVASAMAARPLTFAAAAEGAIRATAATVADALMSVEGQCPVAFDEFLGRPVVSRDGEWRPIRDSDIARMRVEFERRGFKAVPKDAMDTAIGSICDQVRFDSAIEWAGTLAWDGVPRVSESLARYYRTKDTPYTRAAAEYLWTALAGRCLQPGCQADMAIILIGLQGAGKTSAVSAIAPFPSGFGKANLGQRDENLSRRLKGKLVVELPELRGIGNGRDVQGIRDWMTTREEAFVDKYEKFESIYKRRFVAIGTANEDEVLDDAEGERRWLPMRVGQVDVAGLVRDRDQLWAEGIAMWRAGGIRWQEAERLARDEHAEFKVADEWAPIIAEWLDQPCASTTPGVAAAPGSQFQTGPRKDYPVRIIDVLVYGLRVPVERVTHLYKLRVAKILASLNYRCHVTKINGRSVKEYRSQ